MGRKRIVLLVLLMAALLLACSVSRKDVDQGMTPAEIQAAIEQTFAAGATATFTPPPPTNVPPTTVPTAVPTLPPTVIPTDIPTLVPTAVPTLAPTPDTRVILVDPSQFQLKKDDLPWRGEYILPSADWAGPYTNDELIAAWEDPVMARKYLEESGRVTGYEVYYQRGNASAPLPQEIGCSVVQFKAAEGALLALNSYNYKSRDLVHDWVLAEVTLDLGDASMAEYMDEVGSDGNTRREYWVETAYRNYLVECYAWGILANVTPELVEDVTQKMVEKLQTAELSAP